MHPHHSIGDVLGELREEFPDVTISKIRFLESRGLIAPERTGSGYRKFYPADVARLRWILRQQREHFLPLKVIKDRLDGLDPDALEALLGSDEPAADSSAGGAARQDAVDALFESARRDAVAQEADRVAAGVARAAEGHDDELVPPTSGVSLTRGELAAAAGLDDAQLATLESYGLIAASASAGDRVLFGEDALAIARVAARFMQFGMEARHLRMYRTFVERELNLFDQLLLPYRRMRNPEAHAKADEVHRELAALGRRMRAALLLSQLRHVGR